MAEGLVDWRGHVEDMPALMRSMDVIALPSYYREGVPKSLIEAAACGLAVVTTNLPGCREVVSDHGIDGLHVEPRSARSLAECIAQLDDDRDLVRRLGECARRKAMEHFDEQMVIRRTIEVYDELLPARRATARAVA
jgi:glycosyltransferase involved in cell wall biosynthesis